MPAQSPLYNSQGATIRIFSDTGVYSLTGTLEGVVVGEGNHGKQVNTVGSRYLGHIVDKNRLYRKVGFKASGAVRQPEDTIDPQTFANIDAVELPDGYEDL